MDALQGLGEGGMTDELTLSCKHAGRRGKAAGARQHRAEPEPPGGGQRGGGGPGARRAEPPAAGAAQPGGQGRCERFMVSRSIAQEECHMLSGWCMCTQSDCGSMTMKLIGFRDYMITSQVSCSTKCKGCTPSHYAADEWASLWMFAIIDNAVLPPTGHGAAHPRRRRVRRARAGSGAAADV